MQRFQNRLRMGFGDADQRTRGAFGAAVVLFSVLESAGIDTDERGCLPTARWSP